MTTVQESKDVIINLKNGDKISGKLISIDKVNLKIKLIQATKTFKDTTKPNETFENLEISKNEISEIKLVKYEQQNLFKTVKEDEKNVNAIPENKIPQNKEQTKQKTYDKNESFFDHLKISTKANVKMESKNYNEKNKDTFGLKDNENYHQNFRGTFNSYNHGHSNRGQRGKKKYQVNYNNYNSGNFLRGSNRGARNQLNRGRGRGRGRGYYNHSSNYTRPYVNYNFDSMKVNPPKPIQGNTSEVEKSIYDN